MESPAMPAADVARHPNALVRINCYPCQRCLFAGDEAPEGGAEAVYQAAGCLDDPTTCPGTTPDPARPVATPHATSAPLPTSRPVGGNAALGMLSTAWTAETLTPARTRAAPAAAPSRLASAIGRGDPASLIDSAAANDEAGAT